VPQSDPAYRGPVFFNPGGPGGSGILFMTTSGKQVSEVIGPQFDFVSFDPRGMSIKVGRIASHLSLLGVGQSTPPARFFTNDAQRQFFDFSANGYDANTTSDVGANIPRLWAQAQVLGHLAEDNDNGILAHMHTGNVARDMLAMANASGQEKLQYWGISWVNDLLDFFSHSMIFDRYGTVLGATFATMFPVRNSRALSSCFDVCWRRIKLSE
jgi:hypothetical protein